MTGPEHSFVTGTVDMWSTEDANVADAIANGAQGLKESSVRCRGLDDIVAAKLMKASAALEAAAETRCPAEIRASLLPRRDGDGLTRTG